MRQFFQKTFHMGMLLVISLTISGCLIRAAIPLFVTINEDGTITLSISVTNTPAECSSSAFGFVCNYMTPSGESEFATLSLLGERSLTTLLIDPMVIQFPSDASNFAGSFLHNDTSTSGNLVINAGLAFVRVDLDQTLNAELGTQLVIIDLPDGAPTEGNFAFNLNFVLPSGTTSLSMKPMFTGRVVANGETFYPPLLPCVTNFADAPSITTPIPAPDDQINVPSVAGLGCDNVSYNYGTAATAGPASTAIPTLTQWGLILLLGLLGFVGIYYMKRRVY